MFSKEELKMLLKALNSYSCQCCSENSGQCVSLETCKYEKLEDKVESLMRGCDVS